MSNDDLAKGRVRRNASCHFLIMYLGMYCTHILNTAHQCTHYIQNPPRQPSFILTPHFVPYHHLMELVNAYGGSAAPQLPLAPSLVTLRRQLLQPSLGQSATASIALLCASPANLPALSSSVACWTTAVKALKASPCASSRGHRIRPDV